MVVIIGHMARVNLQRIVLLSLNSAFESFPLRFDASTLVFNDPPNHFGCSFPYQNFLSSIEGHQGVWSFLDKLDQVRVNNHGLTLKSRQYDHRSPLPGRTVGYRSGGGRPLPPPRSGCLPLQVHEFLQEFIARGYDPGVRLEPSLRRDHLRKFIGEIDV